MCAPVLKYRFDFAFIQNAFTYTHMCVCVCVYTADLYMFRNA